MEKLPGQKIKIKGEQTSQYNNIFLHNVKKEKKILLKYKEIDMINGFLIYDSFCISLYMRKIFFSFSTVHRPFMNLGRACLICAGFLLFSTVQCLMP
jgi:hypothetical protein